MIICVVCHPFVTRVEDNEREDDDDDNGDAIIIMLVICPYVIVKHTGQKKNLPNGQRKNKVNTFAIPNTL